MRKNNFVSIVIISLNTKKKFIRSLNSAYSQNYKKKEIIVIDGLSKDGTDELIKKNKKKINKLITEKDKGIYDAMNKGIKYANGDWIVFLNSGDIFYKNNIVKKVFSSKSFKNNLNQDIIYGNSIIINKQLKYYVNSKNINTQSIHMPFCHQSSFVKSRLLKKNKFDLQYKICADFNFFINMYKSKKKFKRLDDIFCIVEGGGLSDKSRFRVFNENLKILFKNSVFIKNLAKLIFHYLILAATQFLKKILPDLIIQQILRKKYKKNILN